MQPVQLVAVERARASLRDAAARGRPRMKNVQLREMGATTSMHHISGVPLNRYSLQYQTDDSPQGWVPLLIIAPTLPAPSPRPAVVFLHATLSNKEAMAGRMQSYAAAGYLTAAIDCRYHGERGTTSYQQSLVEAWRGSGERPFLLDNVWDLIHLLDVLEQRPDVDSTRIGMTGVSLGGMHTWLTAAADARVAAAAPAIGVQGFRWAVEHQAFQDRVGSIPNVFQAAAEDLGKEAVDAEVVRAVWDKITPGLLDDWDSPMSLGCIAPRPLLVVNGALDRRCPIPGLLEAAARAEGVYRGLGAEGRLELFIEEGVGHEETANMRAAVRHWFDRHLLGAASETSESCDGALPVAAAMRWRHLQQVVRQLLVWVRWAVGGSGSLDAIGSRGPGLSGQSAGGRWIGSQRVG